MYWWYTGVESFGLQDAASLSLFGGLDVLKDGKVTHSSWDTGLGVLEYRMIAPMIKPVQENNNKYSTEEKLRQSSSSI